MSGSSGESAVARHKPAVTAAGGCRCAGSRVTREARKLFGTWCVLTLESIAQAFRKERFVVQLALNLKTDCQFTSISQLVYKPHGSLLWLLIQLVNVFRNMCHNYTLLVSC